MHPARGGRHTKLSSSLEKLAAGSLDLPEIFRADEAARKGVEGMIVIISAWQWNRNNFASPFNAIAPYSCNTCLTSFAIDNTDTAATSSSFRESGI
jgi:hypothetical protein